MKPLGGLGGLSRLAEALSSRDPEAVVEAFKEVNDLESTIELFKEANNVREENLGNSFKIIGHQADVSPCSIYPPCKFCSLSSSIKEYREGRITVPLEEIVVNSRYMVERGATVLLYGGGISPLSGKIAAEIAESVSRELKAEIVFNVGPVEEEFVDRLKNLGVKRFVLSLETTDKELFKDARPGDSFEKKIEFIKLVERKGVGVSVILMNGVGSEEDLVRSIASLRSFRNLVGIRISTFNPVPGTPWESKQRASFLTTLKACAFARLLFPKAQIDLAAGTPEGALPLSIMAGCGNEIVGLIMGKKRVVDRTEAIKVELAKAGMKLILP